MLHYFGSSLDIYKLTIYFICVHIFKSCVQFKVNNIVVQYYIKPIFSDNYVKFGIALMTSQVCGDDLSLNLSKRISKT